MREKKKTVENNRIIYKHSGAEGFHDLKHCFETTFSSRSRLLRVTGVIIIIIYENISNKCWYLRPEDPGFVNDTVECWESLIISIIFIIWLISAVIRAVMKLTKTREINKKPFSPNWILLMKSWREGEEGRRILRICAEYSNIDREGVKGQVKCNAF